MFGHVTRKVVFLCFLENMIRTNAAMMSVLAFICKEPVSIPSTFVAERKVGNAGTHTLRQLPHIEWKIPKNDHRTITVRVFGVAGVRTHYEGKSRQFKLSAAYPPFPTLISQDGVRLNAKPHCDYSQKTTVTGSHQIPHVACPQKRSSNMANLEGGTLTTRMTQKTPIAQQNP